MPRRKIEQSKQKAPVYFPNIKRKWPWKKYVLREGTVPVNLYEEDVLFSTLKPCIHHKIISPKLRRLYGKLRVRRIKDRKKILANSAKNRPSLFSTHYWSEFGNGKCSFDNMDESLIGLCWSKPKAPIHCKYTTRILKPVIKLGHNKTPTWVKFLSELTHKVKDKNSELDVELYNESKLRFEYLQPHHVPAINALANTYFWSYIDLTCALEYQEFSCVALYKSIIVGFGFMSQGHHLNEGYINFLFVRPHWRNCGIASFILYHLFNTSFIWDNTLHVSSSNPSVLLYQKFGFKPQRIYRGFYDKYLPNDSNDSKNAIYFRLES